MMMTKPETPRGETSGSKIFELFTVATLNRHRALIAGCICVAMAAGLVAALARTPAYTASARLLVENRQLQMTNQQDVIVVEEYLDPARFQNQIEILRSQSLLTSLVQDDAVAPYLLDAVPEPSLPSRILGMDGSGESPAQQALRVLQRDLVITRVGSSHAIDVIFTSTDAAAAATVVQALVDLYVARQTERSAASADIASPWLRQRISSMGPNVSVISPAVVPDRPDGPGRSRTLALFVVLGALLGGVLAFLREYRDDRLRTCAEVAAVARTECLGVIPERAARHKAKRDHEALQTATLQRVRRALGSGGSRGRIVAVGASTADEECAAFAEKLAQRLAAEGTTLLAEVSPQGAEFEQIETATDTRNLKRLQLEPLQDAFWGRGVTARLDLLREDYAHIVLALPPLVPGQEMRELAALADDILLVAGWGRTSRPLLEQASASFRSEASKLRGVIMTRVELAKIGFYSPNEKRVFDAIMTARSATAAPIG